MTFTILLKFLKDYWLEIVVVLAVVLAVAFARNWYKGKLEDAYNRGSDAGVAAQYAKDKDAFDRMQADHDARVKALTDKSTDLAEDLTASKKEAEVKIKSLNAEVAAKSASLSKAYDRTGKQIDCKAETIYLGKDFSDAWNSYNHALAH